MAFGGGTEFSQIEDLPFQGMWSKKQAQGGGSSILSLCSSGFFLAYWSARQQPPFTQQPPFKQQPRFMRDAPNTNSTLESAGSDGRAYIKGLFRCAAARMT